MVRLDFDAPTGYMGHMALDESDRASLRRAFELALDWHGGQCRKRSQIPYVSHLFQAAGLVLEHGGDAHQAVAGFLHDALEDVPTVEERCDREAAIEREFGPAVLAIVRDCTDTGRNETQDAKAPWKERKARYLQQLEQVDGRSLLVAACDKRQNLGAIVGDVRVHGIGYLARFDASPAEQLWYFEKVLGLVRSRIPPRLEHELAELVESLQQLIPAS